MEPLVLVVPPSLHPHTIYNRLIVLLQKVPHRIIHHIAARTSQQSAKGRDTPLEWGAKTLMVKVQQKVKDDKKGGKGRKNNQKEATSTTSNSKNSHQQSQKLQTIPKTKSSSSQYQIYLLVYRANRRLSWSLLKKVLGKKIDPLTQNQVIAMGVQPGAIPPVLSVFNWQGIQINQKIIGQTGDQSNLGLEQTPTVKGLIDTQFYKQEMVAFNIGRKDMSAVLKTQEMFWDGFDAVEMVQTTE